MITLFNDGMDMFVFGDVFMRQYYAVFDYTKKQVGLAVNTDSTEETMYLAKVGGTDVWTKKKYDASTLNGGSTPAWAIALITIGGLILLTGIVILIVLLTRKGGLKKS